MYPCIPPEVLLNRVVCTQEALEKAKTDLDQVREAAIKRAEIRAHEMDHVDLKLKKVRSILSALSYC